MVPARSRSTTNGGSTRALPLALPFSHSNGLAGRVGKTLHITKPKKQSQIPSAAAALEPTDFGTEGSPWPWPRGRSTRDGTTRGTAWASRTARPPLPPPSCAAASRQRGRNPNQSRTAPSKRTHATRTNKQTRKGGLVVRTCAACQA